jgi:hypothetical protein
MRVVACLTLAAAGLIALCSCSSGQPSPTGASGGSPAVSAGSTSNGGAVPASVRISGHYTEEFSTPVPADAAQAKVIEGFRESQVVWDQSTVALRLVGATPAYVTGSALTLLHTVLQSYAKNDITPVGTDRLFDTKITSLTADRATVTSCDDGSAFNVADRKTGQTKPPAPVSYQYDFIVATMVPTAGHWALNSVKPVVAPDARAKACQQNARTHI